MSESNSQDRILYQLKRRGPMSAKALGAELGMTTMGARQHLAQLEADDLVATQPEETQGRGRPVKRWKLTKGGHNRFPDSHAQVTSDLLIAVTELLGESALDQLIQQRTEATQKVYQGSLDRFDQINEKLEALARLRTEEGYMAEVEQTPAGYKLIEHHCPICLAATTCQGFCRSELEVFQSLFEGLATVSREEHLISGARRCSYAVIPTTEN